MFPINDVAGDCIAFGGRVVGKGEPKYLNSQETPLFHKSQVLYGLDKAKVAMASSGVAIVCEGYTDVIALHEGECATRWPRLARRSPCATFASSDVAKEDCLSLRRRRRRSEGGRPSTGVHRLSMTPEAGKTRIELCAVTLPDNLDPIRVYGLAQRRRA